MKQIKRVLIMTCIIAFVIVSTVFAKIYTGTVVTRKNEDGILHMPNPYSGEMEGIHIEPIDGYTSNREVGYLYWDGDCICYATKNFGKQINGKATLGFTLKGDSNKYLVHMYVLDDINPFKMLKIGNKSIIKLRNIVWDEENCLLPSSSGKLTVKMKNGWKLLKMRAVDNYYKKKTIKIGDIINMKKNGRIEFLIRNMKYGFSKWIQIYRMDYFYE